MVDRIASFVQTSTMIKNNLRIESEYAKGQAQLSSGMKASSYEGIARDTNQLLNLESERSRLQTQTENAQLALDRSEAAFDSFGNIIAFGQSFLSDLQNAISNVTPPLQIQDIAQGLLEQTGAILNTTVAGRHIFGGSNTKNPPVDINAAGYGGATPPSAPNFDYYQGNDYVQSVEVSDSYTINYGITANDPALEQIMRAYDLVRTSPADQNALQEALGLMQTGLDDLAVSKAGISQISQSLDKRIDENEESLTLLAEMITRLKEVDLAEVSVRLKEYEAQLQASYAVTTGLLNLNIADFL